MTPDPAIEFSVPGEVADNVRSALAAQTGVLAPPGRWTTILAVDDDASWQMRWE